METPVYVSHAQALRRQEGGLSDLQIEQSIWWLFLVQLSSSNLLQQKGQSGQSNPSWYNNSKNNNNNDNNDNNNNDVQQ